ncbi:MAG TPA: histidine kinase dimerization/phospho-acceptor domain-containing protein, partial [Polyangiaceae bacterium]|nr:histidine kinase dimerization/phospho-acceptor domain-containing protein [Polyangiaceae bacterium]
MIKGTDLVREQHAREGGMTAELGAVLEAERQAVLTRVASSISHALGTPLNVIAGRATMIGMGLSNQDVAENARIIEQQVRNITALLQQILRFARGGADEVTLADPQVLLERVAAAVAPLAASRGIGVQVVAQPASREERFAADAVVHVLIDVLSWAICRLEGPVVLRLQASVGHAEPPPGERGRVRAGMYARFEIQLGELDIEEPAPDRIY